MLEAVFRDLENLAVAFIIILFGGSVSLFIAVATYDRVFES